MTRSLARARRGSSRPTCDRPLADRPRAASSAFDTRGHRYLRGYQLTDPRGLATFQTIYPGWYPERTIHIHVKVRTNPSAARGFAFTSRVYCDDALTDRVHASGVYATRQGRRLRNHEDELYPDGGEQLMLDVPASGAGFKGLFPRGLQIPWSPPSRRSRDRTA